jgi:hypothetical protein
MGDLLFPVYNNFFIGAFQVAINEAGRLVENSCAGQTSKQKVTYLPPLLRCEEPRGDQRVHVLVIHRPFDDRLDVMR